MPYGGNRTGNISLNGNCIACINGYNIEYNSDLPEEDRETAKLYQKPLGLAKGDKDRLLTVVGNSLSDDNKFLGIVLSREKYTPEQVKEFKKEAAKYEIHTEWKCDSHDCYPGMGWESKKREKVIKPAINEYVIKDGKLFGFYFFVDNCGRIGKDSELSDSRLEGIFDLKGNCSGYDSYVSKTTEDGYDNYNYDMHISLRAELCKRTK